MERLKTAGEAIGGIPVSSWGELILTVKDLDDNSKVRGMAHFASEAAPLEVLDFVVSHLGPRGFQHLLHYGELQSGYLLDNLKISLQKAYPYCSDMITSTSFNNLHSLSQLNMYCWVRR